MNKNYANVLDIANKIYTEIKAHETAGNAIESKQYHSAIDRLAEQYNENEKFNRMVDFTHANVMGGYDSKYMDRNDFKVAHKTRFASQARQQNNEDLWDYTFARMGLKQDKKVLTKAIGYGSYKVAGWEVKKVSDKVSKASVRKVKALPKASYISSQKPVATREYFPKMRDMLTFKVVGYEIYRSAVVLHVQDADKLRDIYNERQTEELNPTLTHLVFRYKPLTESGQPNPYCGYTQLRSWLKTQKLVIETKSITLRDQLNAIKGEVVTLPRFASYNDTKSFDDIALFSVFNDFDLFDESFRDKETSEYIPISEYTEKDKDKDGKVIPDVDEVYRIELPTSKFGRVISYECHKEFVEPLPLTYNHISAIFD